MKRPSEEDIVIMDKILVFMVLNKGRHDIWGEFLDATGVNFDSDEHQIYKDYVIEFNNTEERVCQPMSEGQLYQDFECDLHTDRFIKKHSTFKKYFDTTQPLKMKTLIDIIDELLPALLKVYPNGFRPDSFSNFNDCLIPMANIIDDADKKLGLIEWYGTHIKLTTLGYEVASQYGNYSKYIKAREKPNHSSKGDDELSSKLDKVLEGLKRNEMGSEIIFNELEELREQITNLNKKNWTQLLKGKLVDLVATKSLGFTFEAAKHIFTDLTGQSLDKLLN